MKLLRNNGLSITLVIASLVTIVGMLLTGWYTYGAALAEHGDRAVTLAGYIVSGHFLSALFENWESEFLQMSAYVVLTAFLFQKGSAESKDPDEQSPKDENPARDTEDPNTPWPVRAGGLVRVVYSYSLGLSLLFLFLASFILHLRYSAQAHNLQALRHGQPLVSWMDHLQTAEFWFESFQNWQSEFLSTVVLIVLSIFLRFRGSPESKSVAASHSESGG
ncbi:hypothetical protein ACO34A_28435 (plasmid) [Rhizobium sp. ACO-34A]|nr:DUF6766 family protein [Rhizobium sp. ACO-34A]ATN37699.1 hypothetical protein ACO34A_28435 [Rhizobium sp. ACO-34A]